MLAAIPWETLHQHRLPAVHEQACSAGLVRQVGADRAQLPGDGFSQRRDIGRMIPEMHIDFGVAVERPGQHRAFDHGCQRSAADHGNGLIQAVNPARTAHRGRVGIIEGRGGEAGVPADHYRKNFEAGIRLPDQLTDSYLQPGVRRNRDAPSRQLLDLLLIRGRSCGAGSHQPPAVKPLSGP